MTRAPARRAGGQAAAAAGRLIAEWDFHWGRPVRRSQCRAPPPARLVAVPGRVSRSIRQDWDCRGRLAVYRAWQPAPRAAAMDTPAAQGFAAHGAGWPQVVRLGAARQGWAGSRSALLERQMARGVAPCRSSPI